MTIVRVPFTAEQMKFVMDMMMKYPKDHVYHKYVDDAFLYDHLEKWHRYALQVEEWPYNKHISNQHHAPATPQRYNALLALQCW